MTINDHIVTMTPTADLPVRVAALKARLSEYLRAVKRGQQVVIYDRDTPVARLVPYVTVGDTLKIQPPLRALHTTPLPLPVGRTINSLDVLLEDRRSGR